MQTDEPDPLVVSSEQPAVAEIPAVDQTLFAISELSSDLAGEEFSDLLFTFLTTDDQCKREISHFMANLGQRQKLNAGMANRTYPSNQRVIRKQEVIRSLKWKLSVAQKELKVMQSQKAQILRRVRKIIQSKSLRLINQQQERAVLPKLVAKIRLRLGKKYLEKPMKELTGVTSASHLKRQAATAELLLKHLGLEPKNSPSE